MKVISTHKETLMVISDVGDPMDSWPLGWEGVAWNEERGMCDETPRVQAQDRGFNAKYLWRTR